MALDRQSIERKDFPLARRGYDPAAVDAHLSALADQVAELQRAAAQAPATSTLATSTSDQVHAIIAAAETSAAQIRTHAEAEAKDTLERAHRQAGDLAQSSAGMLARLEQTKRELEGVIASLRGGTPGPDADGGAAAEERHLHAVAPADPPRFEAAPAESAEAEPAGPGTGTSALFEPAPPAGAAVEPATPAEPTTPVEPASARAAAAETGPSAPASPQPVAPVPSAPDGGPDETEGARLVALNMALDGTPREQTAQYLSEHFRLADRDGLLDEVYSSVES